MLVQLLANLLTFFSFRGDSDANVLKDQQSGSLAITGATKI